MKYILTDDQIDFIWTLPKITEYALFFTQNVSEEFIRKHLDYLDFRNIINYGHVSEQFLRENIDNIKFNWQDVCLHQKLSEDFIREFKDKVDWNVISFYQKMSNKFILEFKDYLDWKSMRHNENLQKSTISNLYAATYM